MRGGVHAGRDRRSGTWVARTSTCGVAVLGRLRRWWSELPEANNLPEPPLHRAIALPFMVSTSFPDHLFYLSAPNTGILPPAVFGRSVG